MVSFKVWDLNPSALEQNSYSTEIQPYTRYENLLGGFWNGFVLNFWLDSVKFTLLKTVQPELGSRENTTKENQIYFQVPSGKILNTWIRLGADKSSYTRQMGLNSSYPVLETLCSFSIPALSFP